MSIMKFILQNWAGFAHVLTILPEVSNANPFTRLNLALLYENKPKEIVIEPINSVVCHYCNSENIVKV